MTSTSSNVPLKIVMAQSRHCTCSKPSSTMFNKVLLAEKSTKISDLLVKCSLPTNLNHDVEVTVTDNMSETELDTSITVGQMLEIFPVSSCKCFFKSLINLYWVGLGPKVNFINLYQVDLGLGSKG